SGTVSVQFNSTGLSGGELKTVTVHSTDKASAAVTLKLKGTLWKPLDVLPNFAVLNILPDATGPSTIVRMTNHADDYVSISSEPKCSSPAFTAEIRTNHPGREFQIEIKAVPPFEPGNSQATVTLNTTSTNIPVVSIGVWSIVQPKLAVIPAQVALPPAPI